MVNDCVICMQRISIEKILKCNHSFCTHCIDTWIKTHNACPICSQIIGNQHFNQLLIPELQTTPCIDHLYPELNTMRNKMDYYLLQIQNKKSISRNVKSGITASLVTEMEQLFSQMEDNFYIFSCFVQQGKSISQAVGILQHLNFLSLDLQNLLNGRSQLCSNLFVQEYYDDEDQFPQIQQYTIPTKKAKKNEKNKQQKIKKIFSK